MLVVEDAAGIQYAGPPRRSIPARAGEPGWTVAVIVPGKVYPRPCGGAFLIGAVNASGRGLSPPVRGSLGVRMNRVHRQRSIPARAGEPALHRLRAERTGVYPRPCGGALTTLARDGDGGVYPRPCGGARLMAVHNTTASGLSPPVRGSPFLHHGSRGHRGSIPARAGEPGRMRKIYTEGLSPPVRGSPVGRGAESLLLRSIPARAGEPRAGRGRPRCEPVYPRPCGGACLHPLSGYSGLSPPVRGSRRVRLRRGAEPGSIPARAGEPPPRRSATRHRRVYPRPCGGAGDPFRFPYSNRGSIPARAGEPSVTRRSSSSSQGSIPARAGEPASVSVRPILGLSPPVKTPDRVYPRPCGGACLAASIGVK